MCTHNNWPLVNKKCYLKSILLLSLVRMILHPRLSCVSYISILAISYIYLIEWRYNTLCRILKMINTCGCLFVMRYLAALDKRRFYKRLKKLRWLANAGMLTTVFVLKKQQHQSNLSFHSTDLSFLIWKTRLSTSALIYDLLPVLVLQILNLSW